MHRKNVRAIYDQRFRTLFFEPLERRVLLAVVTGVDPLEGSHTAAVSTNVSATFDQTINNATVSDQTFVVYGQQSGRLLSANGDITSLGATGMTVTLDPAADFHPGELVQATVTSGVAGTTPSTPFVWQFRTAATGPAGQFIDSGQTLGDHASYSVSLGDVDGDGDLDAFVANGFHANRVWLNTNSADSADFDADGDVDGRDFLAWQRGFGIAIPNAVKTDGDADNDLDVDGADLGVWELQFGTIPPLAAISSQSSALGEAPVALSTISEPVAAEIATLPAAPQITPLAATAPTAAELADIAFAWDYANRVTFEAKPLVDDQPVLIETMAETFFTLDDIATTATEAVTTDAPSPSSSAEEDAETAWLSDELLERVFG